MTKIEHAYASHKCRARIRGIPFSLTYNEWLHIWEQSGHLADRGRGVGKYCMSRYGDKGGYEIGNVFIQTNSQNSIDAGTGRHTIHSDATKKMLGDKARGRIYSAESRAKMSASRAGEKNYMFGRTHTAEARAKISASHTGKIPWNKGINKNIGDSAIVKLVDHVQSR